MRRQFTLTLGFCLLNCEERTDYRFSAQKGTLTVHPQISESFTKLRSSLVITLATAYFTCSILRPVSLALQRSQATHNPNIVVNGDAELIHVLDFNNQCHVKQTGSLQEQDMRQEVCQVMDGGTKAFERRYQRLGGES